MIYIICLFLLIFLIRCWLDKNPNPYCGYHYNNYHGEQIQRERNRRDILNKDGTISVPNCINEQNWAEDYYMNKEMEAKTEVVKVGRYSYLEID